MQCLYLITPHHRVSLHQQALQIHNSEQPAEQPRKIKLAELDRVTASDSVQFTTQSLVAMVRAGVPLSILDFRGQQVLAQVLHPLTHAGAARLKQYQRSLDPEWLLPLVRQLVAAKAHNQKRVLQRLNHNRPTLDRDLWKRLSRYREQLSQASSLAEVRGFEGMLTREYFRHWQSFLPSDFPFEKRSSRPPRNAVNTCISFGSVLLYSEVVNLLHQTGLDPSIGCLHATENGRFSLALDLIEPFRPAFVEALTLRLLNLRQLRATHFQQRDGGVFLNTEGMALYLEQYEARIRDEFRPTNTEHRTFMRRELQRTVWSFKQALEDVRSFTPFKLT